MNAVPGLRATIQLLPSDKEALFEGSEVARFPGR
jgi:hypothetical protein